MRRAGATRALAFALAAVVPAGASAIEWSARLGLLYDRTDSWLEALPRESQPRLGLDLRLDVFGDVYSPDLFTWQAAVGYARASAERNGQRTSLTNALTYHAGATVLGYRSSPISLSAFADRRTSRDEAAGVPEIGDSSSTSYGGLLRVTTAAAPALILGFSRVESEQQLGTVLDHSSQASTITAGFGHGTAAFNVNASYRGEWSDGSWVSDQHVTHEVGVGTNTRFDADRDLTIVDRYYRRIPTTSAAGSFGSEFNAFRAFFRNGLTPGRSAVLRYSDQRALTSLGGSSDESRANSLRYSHDQALPSPEYFVRGLIDLSRSERRLAALGSETSSGGTLGAELWWRRLLGTGKKIAPGVYGTRLYELAGGPLFGLVDTERGSTEFGFGVSAHARLEFPWNERQVAAQYEASYGSNLFGIPGWSLRQSGSGTVSGLAGRGRYSAALNAAAMRSRSPVFGLGASRSIAATANYGWSRYTVLGQLGLSNGVLPGTDRFVGDGFFVPLGFETRQLTALVQGTVLVRKGLVARADLRANESAGPGQPSTSAWEVGAALTYRYAAFDMSIDNRFIRSADFSRNVFFVRLSRTIGSGP